jgi:c-di-GMP-binding flagellar brake protein YcgR
MFRRPQFLDTQPAPVGARGDGMDEFRVGSQPEMLALLRQLADGSVLVNINASDGSSYTSTLWTVDSHHRKLSFSADDHNPHVQRLVDAGEAVAVAYLDSVKLQFDLTGLVLVHAARHCALQATMPAEMFRFQRRNSYRVRTPAAGSPTAHVRHPAIPEKSLALRVVDVSMGGCALSLPDDVPALAPGTRLEHVRMELDLDTRFEATLTLQHVSAMNPGSGGARLGCQMTSLDGEAQRSLQRYIDQTQKKRRLLTLD